jgi:hypothetical protein
MSEQRSSGWAIGLTAFAGWMMVLIGGFHAIDGLSAIFKDSVIAPVGDYWLKFDTTSWGWIHLILGIVVLLAGIALFSGAVWARTIGVILAVVSALAAFAYIPYAPVWAIVIIVLDAAVIWALTAHGRDIASM